MDIASKNSVTSLDKMINSVAPKKFLRDPLGFFSGYRAYLVYSHLNGMSDESLAKLELKRNEIPAVAAAQVLTSAKAT